MDDLSEMLHVFCLVILSSIILSWSGLPSIAEIQESCRTIHDLFNPKLGTRKMPYLLQENKKFKVWENRQRVFVEGAAKAHCKERPVIEWLLKLAYHILQGLNFDLFFSSDSLSCKGQIKVVCIYSISFDVLGCVCVCVYTYTHQLN